MQKLKLPDLLNNLNKLSEHLRNSEYTKNLFYNYKISIEEIFPDSLILLYKLNKEINKFMKINFDSSRGDEKLYLSENELDSYNQYIIETRESLLVEDIDKDKLIKIEKDNIDSEFRSRIYHPIFIKDNPDVLLNIASNKDYFSEFDLQLINIISNIFALTYSDLFLKNKIKNIKISLDHSKNNIKFLFDKIKDFIFILDLDGNFLHVNNSVLIKLNYTMTAITQ